MSSTASDVSKTGKIRGDELSSQQATEASGPPQPSDLCDSVLHFVQHLHGLDLVTEAVISPTGPRVGETLGSVPRAPLCTPVSGNLYNSGEVFAQDPQTHS